MTEVIQMKCDVQDRSWRRTPFALPTPSWEHRNINKNICQSYVILATGVCVWPDRLWMWYVRILAGGVLNVCMYLTNATAKSRRFNPTFTPVTVTTSSSIIYSSKSDNNPVFKARLHLPGSQPDKLPRMHANSPLTVDASRSAIETAN